MIGEYKIVWAEVAESDLKETIEYIADGLLRNEIDNSINKKRINLKAEC
ncbi:conserved hypothetical protein [Desulfosarcina cetonica]|nr:conserved hypothetical protein [Desulfosarcina cetonica]